VGLERGADGDLYVVAESGEKFHQAADAKVARAIAHQQGNLRLLDSEDFGELESVSSGAEALFPRCLFRGD